MLSAWYNRLHNFAKKQAELAPVEGLDDRLLSDIGLRRGETTKMDLDAVAAASMFPWHRPSNASVASRR